MRERIRLARRFGVYTPPHGCPCPPPIGFGLDKFCYFCPRHVRAEFGSATKRSVGAGGAMGLTQTMLDSILRFLLLSCLSLRYRIQLSGFERLARQDERGILFLANHPALIDPVILLCYLTTKFNVRVLAASDQVDRPVIGWLAERVHVRRLFNATEKNAGSRHQIASMLRDTARSLKQGEALLLYPAGRVYRSRLENLSSNSAAAFLIHSCPGIRVVLIRTHGLWGSAFSRANGSVPQILPVLGRGVLGLLKSALIFAPRRSINIAFAEPEDFPRRADRNTINRYLEDFYNASAPPNTYVPYSIWERGGTRVISEQDG